MKVTRQTLRLSLIPSLPVWERDWMVRFKNRYLLVELSFGSVEEGCQALRPATPKSLVQLVREAVLALHGDYGLACVKQSLNVKYMNILTRVAIIRCPRAHHRAVWSAISTITSIEKVPCAINMLHVGGTIKSCQKFLIKHNKQKLREMMDSAKDPVERRQLEATVEAILKNDAVPLRV